MQRVGQRNVDLDVLYVVWTSLYFRRIHTLMMRDEHDEHKEVDGSRLFTITQENGFTDAQVPNHLDHWRASVHLP